MRHSARRTLYSTHISRHILLRCIVIAVPVILLLTLILFMRRYSAHNPEEIQREWAENTEELTIIEQYVTQNDCYITGKMITVKGLMLHSVGTAQPSAQTYAEQFNTFQPNGREVCPHAFLQADGTVYQILPWEMYGWHAGGTSNRTHIGIEMCEPAELIYTDVNTFYAADRAAAAEYVRSTYEIAVQLFAALCIRYNLDPLEKGVILSHSEAAAQETASSHSDPEHLWQGLGLPYTMDTFRADVAARVKSLTA